MSRRRRAAPVPDSELERAARIGAHYALLWGRDPAELAQDARVVLWQEWPRLTARYGPNPERALLYVVVRRRLVDELRRDGRQTRPGRHRIRTTALEAKHLERLGEPDTSAQDRAELEARHRAARARALELYRLARNERERLILSRLAEGHTVRAIAGELGLHPDYVSQLLGQLRRRARNNSRLEELSVDRWQF